MLPCSETFELANRQFFSARVLGLGFLRILRQFQENQDIYKYTDD